MRVRPWTVFSQSLFSRALAAALRCSKVNLFMFVPSQILYTRVWLGNYSRILYFFLLSTGRKNQSPKHNTSAHTCDLFCQPPPFCLYLSLWLSLCWSLSLSAVMLSLIHAPISLDTFLFPPLHPALSCYSQLAAGVWETHTCARKTEQHADA